ncbi:MAG: hypothetical protein SCALA702_16050 [Melioribacteraceae bacterium]|nr:MAG: hypothetical protein SCALA702_16050 [Melioribacteraceae bacterium]
MELIPPISDKNDFTFLLSESETTKFSEVSRQAYGISKLLKQYPPESRIGLFTSHSENFIQGLLAIWYAGYIPVPLGNIVSADKLEEIADKTGISTIIYDDKTAGFISRPDGINLDACQSNSLTDTHNVKFQQSKTAIILLTSGSTGSQKQIPLTFKNLFSGAEMIGEILTDIKSSVLGATLPFFHVGGFSQITRAIFYRTGLYIPNEISSKSIAELIRTGKASTISIVPATLNHLLEKNIKPHKNVKHIFVGGSATKSEDVVQAIKAGYPIYKVYGSTETGAMITLSNPAELKKLPHASGKVLPGVKIKIIDDNGKMLSANNEGKIVVSSPTLSPGVTNTGNEYPTGDLGYLDTEGNLVVTGRTSRIIISGGYNVNPLEIEETILLHPEIKSVYVSSVPDDKWGEKVVALIVVNPGFDETRLRDFLTARLPGYKIPKEFIPVQSIPLTPLGKPDKNLIDSILLEHSKK